LNEQSPIRSTYLPSREKMSVFSAALVMTLLEGRLVHLPTLGWNFTFLGIKVGLRLSVPGVLALVIAALTAAGTDWVMSDHPSRRGRSTATHWILPALTIWVLEVLLQHLPLGWLWWVVLFVGIGLWFLVIVAEYIVIDSNDLRYPIASAGLNGLGFLIFFLMAVGVKAVPWRLFFAAPTFGITAGLVALRAFHLRFPERWLPIEATFIAAIAAQLAAAIYYLPLSSLAFGLVLVGTAYAATVYLGNVIEEQAFPQSVTEPAVVLALTLLLLPWAW